MALDSIGRYQLIEEIGRGGMANVFRAHDPRFKRDVAVKLMTRDLLEDPTLKARFEREAQTIAALEHPAIVPVYDFGEEDGRPYLVMRLMQAQTLEHRLKNGPLSITETSAILDRVGSALERAHEKGIIHRDLKPSNIMFDDYGDAFLADFGIARLTESAITLTGDAVIGTPAYMSPEQIHGDKEIDGRSDIYALGVICFEMLTGQRPYVDSTPAKVMMRHIMDPVPRIRETKPDLPEGVETIIANTMAKEPDKRYQTPHEMTDTLSAISKATVATAAAASAAQELEQVEESEPAKGIATDLQDAPETEPAGPEMETAVPVIAAPAIKKATEPAVVPTLSQDETDLEEDAYPETEVALPSFVDQGEPLEEVEAAIASPREDQDSDKDEYPETEAAVPSFVSQEDPNTLAAAPSFVGQEPAADETARASAPTPAEADFQDDSTGGKWLVYGLVGVLAIIILGAVIGGGLFLSSQLGGDEEDESGNETAKSTTEETIIGASSEDVRESESGGQPSADQSGEVVDEIDANARFSEAERLMERFYLEMEDENWDEAMAAVEQSIALVPENPHYLHEQAFLLYTIDELDPALNVINRAIEMDPGAGNYYELRSRIFFKLDDLAAALEDGLRSIEWDGAGDSAFSNLGDIYAHLGDYENALQAFNTAIDINPEDAEHYSRRAQMLEQMGEFEAAASDLVTAFDLDPEAYWYLDQLGSIVVWGLEDLPWALEIYSQLIELQPNDAWPYVNRGAVLRQLGDYETALTDINRAIELDPEESWFFVELAYTNYDAGNLDETIASWERGIGLDPSNPDLYQARGEFYFWELGEFEAALEDYTRAIEFDPENTDLYVSRAELQQEFGNYNAALEDLGRAISMSPEEPWLFIETGDLYLELGDVDSALGEYERAIALDPEDPSLYQYKANLLAWDIGNYDAALEAFEQCLKIEPGMPWCLLDLAWLFDYLGQTQEAVERFQLFIENVDPTDCPECIEEAQQYIDQNN